MTNAFKGSLRCAPVSSPVISIDDEDTGARALATEMLVHKEFGLSHLLRCSTTARAHSRSHFASVHQECSQVPACVDVIVAKFRQNTAN